MPRYASQNLASISPEYRKAHNLDSAGKRSTRYTYGKNVLIAAGNKIMSGGLCLRLLPVIDETTKDFTSFREGEDAFGDWGRLMTCANWVGNPGVCFVIHDGNPAVNLYDSPYHVLRNVAYKHKDQPGLGRLFTELLSPQKQLETHIGSLAKPDKILFISASVVFTNDNGQTVLGAFSDDQDRDARVIGLKFSAAQAFYNALSATDESGAFLSGDMLSIGAAKLVTILPESFREGSQQKVMGIGVAGPEAFHCPKYARGDRNATYVVGYPPSRSDFTHFAFLHDTYQGQQITLDAHAETLASDTKTWEDRVYVPNYEEQAALMAPAFPREALEFAWREHPEYIRTLAKGTTTSVPSATVVEESWDDEPVAPAKTPTAAKLPARPAAPKPADPPAPWDPPAAELSPEEEAGVVDMFNAVPEGAVTAPPPPPAATAPAQPATSSADVIARARARAAAAKR